MVLLHLFPIILSLSGYTPGGGGGGGGGNTMPGLECLYSISAD